MIVRATLLALLVIIAVAAVGLVACGDNDEKPDASGIEDATTVEDETVPDGASLIDQDDLKFIPNELTVSTDEPIYFRNSETALHTVTINGRNVTGNMGRDDVMIWTPPGPGPYQLTCDFHPQMKATITAK
ncbi:MAG TPA: cupredoxin domain-containing protein [Dehalococcoidia bacterium]|nr:cupredoxin domain-containing protein [Dehalococcoidia bacterium]